MSTASGQTPPRSTHSSASSSSSTSNSFSLIQVDELSSFGATKQNRLPALIKLNPLADSQQQQLQQRQAATSMPHFSASEVEKMAVTPNPQAESMPAQLLGAANKENSPRQPKSLDAPLELPRTANESDDFQVVDMDEEEAAQGASNADLVGPSLPAPNNSSEAANGNGPAASANFSSTSFAGEWDAKSLSAQLQSSHLGDSLIEMIINLRNENQNLVRALETNNDYVKERLQEFKRCQEEAKRREADYALEKAELEHQARKLRRQNEVLGERLKSLEGKLKELNAELGDTLEAAHSSKASSVRGDNNELYPQLAPNDESFSNAALAGQHQPSTMQMDATSGQLHDRAHAQSSASSSASSSDEMDGVEQQPKPAPGSREEEEAAKRLAAMSKEELSKHFDATKAQFYSLDDPMKQCDQLEKQLNDIGRRDYEICLLQQQLNIYRQDFRLERMAKLEAKIQIEKLKADIDRLCVDRVQEQQREREPSNTVRFGPTTSIPSHHSETAGAGANLIGKLGHHLGKKAVRSAAKAAKYAAKQAHLEEKAAAALARAQAARATAAQFYTTPKATETDVGLQQRQHQQAGAEATGSEQFQHQQHRGHHRHSSASGRPHRSGRGKPGLGSEVVNDLLSTANKAMLTGYKMASTHANLVLDKLSQFEQQQAAQLDPKNKPPIQKSQPATLGKAGCAPSAPPMEPPSID